MRHFSSRASGNNGLNKIVKEKATRGLAVRDGGQPRIWASIGIFPGHQLLE